MIGQLLAAFIGTLAFSALFYVPREHALLCGVVGCAGWLIYCLSLLRFSAVIATLFSTLTIAILSRILAVLCREPANIILIPGLFPIIPGVGIYNTIFNLINADLSAGIAYGLDTFRAVCMIVLGIVVIFSLPGKWFSRSMPYTLKL